MERSTRPNQSSLLAYRVEENINWMTACSSKQNASDVAAEEGITDAHLHASKKLSMQDADEYKATEDGPKFNYKFQEHVVGIGVDIEVTEVHGGKKSLFL